ncbi:hypothetical protein EJ08DRAFT_682238 [Tothia fuscella]|uniref:Uncharacterized protein n=1 Tax=Tothia fuscella TaxID=1048955 RepID=A0A9P4NIQ3_9PEZI|nr:hypothetical protein EJ08DRAFT_682238 [Tothia fuscella]
MNRIISRTKALEDAMKRIRNGVGDPKAQTVKLLALDWDMMDEIRQSSREVRRGPELNLAEATSLLGMMRQIMTLTTSATDGWMRWKPMVEAAKLEQDVLKQLKNTWEASATFCDTMNDKGPAVARQAGTTYKKELQAVIERAIRLYSGRK